MKIVEIRRENLREWFSNRALPTKLSERSYISQLLNGKQSFGERAARRLEQTYGMGHGYLDGIQIHDNNKIVDEFAWVYHHASQAGKVFLENAIKVAAESFVQANKQGKDNK